MPHAQKVKSDDSQAAASVKADSSRACDLIPFYFATKMRFARCGRECSGVLPGNEHDFVYPISFQVSGQKMKGERPTAIGKRQRAADTANSDAFGRTKRLADTAKRPPDVAALLLLFIG